MQTGGKNAIAILYRKCDLEHKIEIEYHSRDPQEEWRKHINNIMTVIAEMKITYFCIP